MNLKSWRQKRREAWNSQFCKNGTAWSYRNRQKSVHAGMVKKKGHTDRRNHARPSLDTSKRSEHQQVKPILVGGLYMLPPKIKIGFASAVKQKYPKAIFSETLGRWCWPA